MASVKKRLKATDKFHDTTQIVKHVQCKDSMNTSNIFFIH